MCFTCTGEYSSQNEHRDVRENHSAIQDYSQLSNNVDQGIRNNHVPNQNITAVTHAAPLRFSEHAENVNQESTNRLAVSSQITAPVTRATQGHIAAVNSPFFISLPFGRTR